MQDSREVRHILLSVHKQDDSIDWVKSRAQADDVYNQLKNGGDFAALAKKYSQDPGSKDNGGKYTVARGQTVAPFEQTAFNLDVGELSRPVKTEYGYHLIEPLGEVKVGHITPFTQVYKKIKADLLSTKKQEAITEWAAKLSEGLQGQDRLRGRLRAARDRDARPPPRRRRTDRVTDAALVPGAARPERAHAPAAS